MTVADEFTARAADADQIRAATVERTRYLAVDPVNRLVANTLEASWKTARRELAKATDTYEHAKTTHTTAQPSRYTMDTP